MNQQLLVTYHCHFLSQGVLSCYVFWVHKLVGHDLQAAKQAECQIFLSCCNNGIYTIAIDYMDTRCNIRRGSASPQRTLAML